jgi:hypothetical protein
LLIPLSPGYPNQLICYLALRPVAPKPNDSIG